MSEVAPRLSRLFRELRAFFSDMCELQERWLLLNRPWEEEFLHWTDGDGDARLHGHLAPPRGPRRSVTSRGWCPGCRQPWTPRESDDPISPDEHERRR